MGRFIINLLIRGKKHLKIRDRWENMSLSREKLRLFLTFIMGICVLTGCNQFSSTKEHAVKEEQKGEALEEKTDDLSEEQMPEEEERISTYKEVAALGLPEDMLAYWMVLNNKYPFISTEEGKQEFYWDEYYWCLGYPAGYHQADYITIVDMDGDGANEIVLYCLPESVQILHYEDGVVYSYQDVFRGMKRIHANGIYEGSDGAASTGYYRMTELNRNGYTEEKLASMDGDYWEIGGVEVTQEEFDNYIESIEDIELAENIEFTEDMLDAGLLGNLSEEELSIVKHAPIKEMEATEKNALTEGEEMQAYHAVLLSEKSFISVTDDGREYYLNNYHLRKGRYDEDFRILYYSIVDMDQDGINELVLTGWDTTQIMHYEAGKIYSYQFDYDEIGAIANDGVFSVENGRDGYGKIVSFEADGCVTKSVDNHNKVNEDRIRYYFFSEDAITNNTKP